MKDVVIVGSGLAGNLAAAYLRTKLPRLGVTLIGMPDAKSPVVGESVVEYGSRFFHEIGLGPMLEEKHYHKYGLTFYYKESLDDPECRRYTVHEAPGVLRVPAYQIHRAVFDPDLREHNRALGAELVDGTVAGIELGGRGAGHAVRYRTPAGDEREVVARWLIDATGRRRMLARRLKLHRKETGPQRSAFWFRLAGFDAAVLDEIEAVKQRHYCFDSYYSTHHFFGRGNWLWLIPLRSDRPRALMSVGLVTRPDLYPAKTRCLEEFLDNVGREHPLVRRLVESGTVMDANAYLDYQYDAARYYSADGWFLLGDAAMTFDPLFSFGISMAAVQTTQIASMIKKDLDATLSEDYVRALEEMIGATRRRQEATVAEMYAFMHEPLRLSWTVQVANAGWFHALLPLFMTGAFTEARYARYIAQSSRSDSLDDLLRHVSRRIPRSSAAELENHLEEAVNWRLFRSQEADLPRYLARLQWVRARFRYRLLRRAGRTTAVRHLALCCGDLMKALGLLVLARLLLRRGRAARTRAFDFDDPFLDPRRTSP